MTPIRDLVDEMNRLYSKGDLDGMAELFAEDAVMTIPAGHFEGRDQIREYWGGLWRAFPDGNTEIGRNVQDGDTLFAEVTSRGTNTGEFILPDGTTVPATGKAGELPGMMLVRVRDGKVVENNWYYDPLSLMSQLGLMPS